MPEGIAPLWEAFCQLSVGDEPLSLAQLHAWQQVHAVRLTGWEVDTLIAMDRAARAAMQRLRAQ